MYRVVVSLLLMFTMTFGLGSAANAQTPKIVAHSKEANVTLYATERAGYYESFEMKDGKWTKYFPFWRSSNNPTYSPRILYEDINLDGKKELIIVLIKGHGTGALDSEVHVFHPVETKWGRTYREVLVDNPMAVVLKSAKVKSTRQEVTVTIGDTKSVIDISNYNINPDNLFEEISLGSIISYDVRENGLRAAVSLQISPAAFLGYIVITYQFKDGMYQASQVEFARDW